MRFLVVLSSILFALPTWAVGIYLVAPKTVTVNNSAGVSCLAAQQGQGADLTAPHLRMPVTIANPQRATFVPNSFRVVIFTKGEPQTCEVSGEAMKAMGMGLPIPYGYQMTSSCDLGCGHLNIPVNRKFFATVEVYGDFVFENGTKKTEFQETSFEVLNFGTAN
jgi:hypothetical protein